MKVPFTWKVTGWFMVGWSPEFPVGEVRPLHYFGEDLVAYRDESGELHVLEANCKHLGAHIGHGGKVVGDCVQCPFHGWRWGPDGTNRYIPYQPDRPNRALRLRVFPVREQYDCVFIWHHPDGKEPQWEMPDIFRKFPQFETDPAAYYRAYPEFSRRAEREPVHPQIVAENAPDSAHFEYVHHATVTPRVLDWKIVDQEWQFIAGWPDARSDNPDDLALRFHSHLFGLGGAISVFEGAQNHRLIFTCTPVDDECSDLFYSIWWPRIPGDDSDVPHGKLRELIEKQFLSTVFDDLQIWRYQKYVEHPALSKIDAKGYMALRKWARQFYEVPQNDVPHEARSLPNSRRPSTPRSSPRSVRVRSSARTPGWRILAEEARRVALPNIVRLLPAARAAGVRVVHCLVQHRPDGLGSNHNAKIFAIGAAERSTSLPARPERRCCPS